MEQKKNLLTREGLKKYEEELILLKDVKRGEVSRKIAEAREQGDLSENAEYSAAKDEQAKIEARIAELEELLKHAEVIDVEGGKKKAIAFGSTVTVLDLETNEKEEYMIVGSSEANILNGTISNESPLGAALMNKKKGDIVEIEAPVGMIKYKVEDFKS